MERVGNIKRGRLLKQSQYLKHWNPRTFELDPDLLVRTLRYFDLNGKFKGEIPLTGARCYVELMNERSYGKPHCFALTTDTRQVLMSASTESIMREWIDCIVQNGASLRGQESNRSIIEERQRRGETLINNLAASFVSSGLALQLHESSPRTSRSQTLDDRVFLDRGQNPVERDERMLTLAAEVEHELVALGLVKEHLVSPDGGKWSIFLSRDWSSYTKLVLLLGHAHGVPLGVWSRSGCTRLGLEHGSMLSYVREAHAGGYAILCCNLAHPSSTTEAHVVETNKSDSHVEHNPEVFLKTIWHRYILGGSRDTRVFIIAYAWGGSTVSRFFETKRDVFARSFDDQLKALACIESDVVELSNSSTGSRVMHWHASTVVPCGELIPSDERCLVMSAGSSYYLTAWSNRVATLPLVRDQVFHFFDFCFDVDDLDLDVVGTSVSQRWARFVVHDARCAS